MPSATGSLVRNAAALAEPVKADHVEKEALTVEQVHALLSAAEGTRDEAPIVVLMMLGLRRGELLGLQWSDVDFRHGTLRIRRALKRGTRGLEVSEVKTQRSARTLHLPQRVSDVLKAHRTRQKEERLRAGEHWAGDDWVFTNAWGGPIDPDNFRHRFTALCEQAGIGHWSPHSLRHTAGSLMFEHGADLKVVSETLGHSSIRAPPTYTPTSCPNAPAKPYEPSTAPSTRTLTTSSDVAGRVRPLLTHVARDARCCDPNFGKANACRPTDQQQAHADLRKRLSPLLAHSQRFAATHGPDDGPTTAPAPTPVRPSKGLRASEARGQRPD